MASLYHLVLLNDNHHSFDYVIDMLTTKFPLSEDKAIEHAMDVHMNGRTILLTGEREDAETGRDWIEGCGADPRVVHSKGSMRAIVEPAE
jgi:ATP-dependent Clp protease adaptor protein ClpS